MSIKSKLKDIMESKGISIAKLASDSGVAIETIRRARDYEIRLCRLETLEAIAKALGIRIKDLFEEPSQRSKGTGSRGKRISHALKSN